MKATFDIDYHWRLAKSFAFSRFFEVDRSAMTENQAFTLIVAGHAQGIDPFTSVSQIRIIKGNTAFSAALIASKIREHEHYDYDIVELTEETCSLRFTKDGEEIGVSTFTIQDADKAGLLVKEGDTNRQGKQKEAGNYEKFPRNMLFARAMTNGQRWYCPDLFNGPVYTFEELQPDVELDAAGNVVISSVAMDDTPRAESDEPEEQRQEEDKPQDLSGEADTPPPPATEAEAAGQAAEQKDKHEETDAPAETEAHADAAEDAGDPPDDPPVEDAPAIISGDQRRSLWSKVAARGAELGYDEGKKGLLLKQLVQAQGFENSTQITVDKLEQIEAQIPAAELPKKSTRKKAAAG